MPTPAILAFTYAVLATPFLVWAFFRYSAFKSQKVYYESVHGEMIELQSSIRRLQEDDDKMQTELSSIKLKVGFGGEKEGKSYF